MLHNDYNSLEVAYIYDFKEGKALWSRNEIVTGDKIKNYYGKTDYFVSAARYNNDLYKHINDPKNESGKVKGFDGSVWYDFIIIDVDEKSPRKVALFMEHLEINYGIQIDYCRIYFSGSKGFHVLIPTPLFGLKPSEDLPTTIKTLVAKIADNIQNYDLSLYDKLQVYRLPHTRHSSTGLFKIPLYYNELTRGISFITKKSEKQRFKFDYPEYPTDPVAELEKLIGKQEPRKNGFNSNVAESNGNVDEFDGLPPFRKLCILHMLKGVEEHKSGGRDETAIRLATHFRKEKYGFDVVLGLLHGWNVRNTPPMSDEEIRAKVISVFQGNFDYGCKDDVMLINCDPNCYLFRR